MADVIAGRVQEVSLAPELTAFVRHGQNTIEIRPDGTIIRNGVVFARASNGAAVHEATAGRVQGVSLRADLTTIVHYGQNTIEIGPDGTIIRNGVVFACAAHDEAAHEATELRIGQKMPDGTLYAGLSPSAGERMFAAEKDAPLAMKWRKAMEYAAGLDAHGHNDWRTPTKEELNQLFRHSAEIRNFTSGNYWSSSRFIGGAWAQDISGGHRGCYFENYDFALRCVR